MQYNLKDALYNTEWKEPMMAQINNETVSENQSNFENKVNQ